MKINERSEKIIDLLNETQFLTVSELSNLCSVSEMTIRRDLEKLDTQGRIKRTYGGAVSVSPKEEGRNPADLPLSQSEDMLLLEKMDVIIASSVDPYFDSLLVNRAMKKGIPIIAESIEIPNQRTIVAVDNYQAGYDLGVWAQEYLHNHGVQKVNLLDLTFHQPNTLDRSSGFADGINSSGFTCEKILSINAESRYASAYQIAQDALTVHPQINLIFAINDITALGAMAACRDLGIDPSLMTVLTFGLEGRALIDEIMKPDSYCKAGLAMFPEIIGRVCIREAVAAYNHLPQQKYNITPHVVLSADNLRQFYTKTKDGWKFNWDAAQRNLDLPKNIEQDHIQSDNCPKNIGLIVPFPEHEWYENLTNLLKEHAEHNGVNLQVIDADQCVRDEVNLRRRQIARKAASLVNPGDVLLIDSGPVSYYLAEELKNKNDLTVITNSIDAFDSLNRAPGIILISTGGALRPSTQSLVGPTAELTLKELRADKLFLMVSGITQDFGLSHHTISEVTIKQAMIKSTREVIVVADHSAFKADVGIQVAPLDVVDQLITDDALPPTIRLDLSKTGIRVEIV